MRNISTDRLHSKQNQVRNSRKIAIKARKQVTPIQKTSYSSRFQQLLRICENMSNGASKQLPKSKTESLKIQKQLMCTDETMQTLKKSRASGVKSSRCYRLDLPQIDEKQCQEDQIVPQNRSICLTQRVMTQKTINKQNTQMSTSNKTKSTNISNYKAKIQHKALQKQITPFDKCLNLKLRLNLDVRQLLKSKSKSKNKNKEPINQNKYSQSKLTGRKVNSSMNNYNDHSFF